MIFTAWFLIAGGLLIFMALAGSILKRLPLSTAMVYLAVGVGLGPLGAGLLDLNLLRDATLVEHLAEVAVLGFNEQLERIGEVAVVILVGGMLSSSRLPAEAIWFVPLLFLVIRPLSVWLGLLGSRSSGAQRGLIAWFGIRGIGSVYYLAYAAQHSIEPVLADRIGALVLTVVAASIVVHGISVTPLMRRYRREQARLRRGHESAAEG